MIDGLEWVCEYLHKTHDVNQCVNTYIPKLGSYAVNHYIEIPRAYPFNYI